MVSQANDNPTNPAYIGLVNPKTLSNVDGVMRASGCYRVEGVFYTGNRYEYAKRAGRQFEVDTQNVAAVIPQVKTEDLLASVPKGAKVVCVDLVVGATPLPEFTHPEHAFYVFGPEDGTIPQHIIDASDSVVYVPTVGCMNLAASVNVLLYDRLAKSSMQTSDELIKQSRDNNNRTSVKSR
ncbi:RNA methyltransferase [Shewanella maritima]|uniref:RNA methyltransferase n=1 Tax=Shewanella maritima TaxID=2520507 RepID=UPI003735AB52